MVQHCNSDPMVLTVMITVNGADRCVGLTRWSIIFLRLLCPKSYLPFEVKGCCANIMICSGGAGAQHACCRWSSGKAAIVGSASERCVELPVQQVVPSLSLLRAYAALDCTVIDYNGEAKLL